ncbi:hypothetical protein SAMN05444280_103116 [Tangfeifania diversioriginum]|uniref:Uncharacterized protein n=1 Tax=Tangfeifania diversioriginum TaxID=1168035 RepID=A0A1M6C2K4_9BACT|nr:hypothetical protein [Tangfeifania diversioriginum]SHI55275.1 hypothetical protein SAMN05444280_103116 [Tangfeifania diversioriginum]
MADSEMLLYQTKIDVQLHFARAMDKIFLQNLIEKSQSVHLKIH